MVIDDGWVGLAVEVPSGSSQITVGGDEGCEVVVSGSYRPVEGAPDTGGVVVGSLLEVGLAVESESDSAGWLPVAEVRFCEVEIAVGSKPRVWA